MAEPDQYEQVFDLDPTLRLWAERFAARHQQTDDLLQETYLRAWAGWSGFQPGSDLRGWLYTIMRNVWIDWQRRPSRGKFLPAGLPTDIEDHHSVRTFDYQPDGYDPIGLLAEAAEAVPADFLQVVLMLDVDGISRQDVASMLGIAEGTVSSRAHRARVILRERLEELAARYGRL